MAAGVPPAGTDPPSNRHRNALHVAASAGQEGTALALLGAMATRAEFETPTETGDTAVALLRQADMGGIARRLEAAAGDRFK